MKPSSWDKQLGLALPLERAAGQSRQTNNPSKNEMRLDVSHHTSVFPRGGEKLFFLTSSFIGRVQWGYYASYPRTPSGGGTSRSSRNRIFENPPLLEFGGSRSLRWRSSKQASIPLGRRALVRMRDLGMGDAKVVTPNHNDS